MSDKIPTCGPRDTETKRQRLLTALTKLSVEAPPEDLPYDGGQGRLDQYQRGRWETWEWFESELETLLKEHGAFGETDA